MHNKIILTLLLSICLHLAADAQHVLERRPFRVVPKNDIELPPSVDNSRLKYFPPVLNQTGGSCAQASSVGYMLTYEFNRLLRRDASASRDNRLSYQFSWNMLNDGRDQGGFINEGLMLAKGYGMMTENDYGISGMMQFKWATGYEKYRNAMRHRVKAIYTFADSVPLMRRYLYDKGVLGEEGGVLTFSGKSTGWTIDSNYEGPSLTGYRSLLTSLADDGSHAMTIVGYDDTVAYTDAGGVRHTGAFIVVNTWGGSWQDEGRFYLPYDFFRDPSVANATLSDDVQGVDVEMYEPLLVARATIDYTSRDDLYFRTGHVLPSQPLASHQLHMVQAFRNQGGDLPMQGQYMPSSIELAIDMTNQLNDSCTAYCFNIVRGFRGEKQGHGRLVSLAIIDYRPTLAAPDVSRGPIVYDYREPLPAELKNGSNTFLVPTRPRFSVTTSGLRYADDDGTPSPSTFILGTTDGRRAKAAFQEADSANQTITIKYELK